MARPFTVVGIAAAGFAGTDIGSPIKIFVPVAMQPTVAPTSPRLDDERAAWFYPFARLKPGVTREQAEAAMKVLYGQRQDVELGQSYFSRFPESRKSLLSQTFTLEPGGRGHSNLRGRFERPLILLECLAAAVLLIACANIAGLLLARGAASQRDLAIRRAIGASRARIVGQLFTESVLLATVSAVAALFVGSWLTRLLISLMPTSAGDLPLSATPDLRVLAFTAPGDGSHRRPLWAPAGLAELAGRCRRHLARSGGRDRRWPHARTRTQDLRRVAGRVVRGPAPGSRPVHSLAR